MARRDPHSWCDDQQPKTRELRWRAKVDFATRTLDAEATLLFEAPASGTVDLDSRELSIREAVDERGKAIPFQVEPPDPILGSRIRLQLPERTGGVTLRYSTAPTASALQWLSPGQTAGGKEPFLFSQCQAIHARSVVPLQDTPRIRITFQAELTLPRRLKAVMAAGFEGREEKGEVAVERYAMPQPIPPYLFALAVGDLASRDLSPRSRVWAEPKVVDRAAYEFADVEKMISAAEKLFGPYDWERFDILTMPPSFPYGGMENPRLTFITPTLLAGDRSLVGVIAHELAHSWTGNLVTNASAEHFWLNEGCTVFAERRIQEALEGPEMAALHAALGRKSLDQALEQLAQAPELTKLHPNLKGVDPDEAFSQVPYEKGYLFLRALEDAVGREKFDEFLRAYLEKYRFQSTTTEDFAAFARERLPGKLEEVNAAAWFDEPGVPANAPRARSARLDAIEKLAGQFPGEASKRWTPTEWQLYLESVPRPAPQGLCEKLDAAYALTSSTNSEVLVSWLILAARSGYQKAYPRIREVLRGVGRMKYLKPLYLALATRPESKELARRYFDESKAGYHPIARQVSESLLRQCGV